MFDIEASLSRGVMVPPEATSSTSLSSSDSSTSSSSEGPAPLFSSSSSTEGQPKPVGIVHPTLQQVDCHVKDIPALRSYLGGDDPLLNWQSEAHEIDPVDLFTAFPQDDCIAFYTPDSDNNNTNRYARLTYKELHQELRMCPSFNTSPSLSSSASASGKRIAIVLPAEQMAEMAMALLSIMAQGGVAVPLDPRMPLTRVLEAMQQLQCTCLVATPDIITSCGAFLEEHASEGEVYYQTPLNFHDALAQVDEVRVVQSRGACGRLEWAVFVKNITEAGAMIWRQSTECTQNAAEVQHATNCNPEDPVMLLRTSGTTSTPKVVPISRSMLIYGALSIATALKLKRNDCNANSMPFFHIGGISCNLLAVLISGGSVLLAGPLKDSNIFLDHVTNPSLGVTWYYAGPSMHKVILLMAESRAQNGNKLSNRLRFIRSASAHLNHDLALRLSKVFQCQVIPTYGMSEAMPICSSAPIDIRKIPPCKVVDSVGYPAGTSVCILDPKTETVLSHGTSGYDDQRYIGEIAVRGAGVISHYIGLDVAKTHTADGWLKTGDHGMLDRNGRLFIKGRSKEMIKRGGEQVWPNEIDDVVEKVQGVATAVSFGVPNELWGEEVAVAVVLQNPSQINNLAFLKELKEDILSTCRQKLDEISLPQQFRFLPHTDDLPKGSTGKYIRSKMADHLTVSAVDTGALRVLETVSRYNRDIAQANVSEKGSAGAENNNYALPATFWDWLNSKAQPGRRVVPSEALNGVRFLVACFVVQVHVGRFPNLTWVKIQGYQPNMMIFLGLAAFQTACSVARSIRGQWASFVGTKIGSLHGLFVIAQLVTLPSYVLFQAFDEERNMIWDMKDWLTMMAKFTFATLTGLGHGFDVNKFTWFQSTFYAFLIMFPFLDHYFRCKTMKIQAALLLLSGTIAASVWGILYLLLPADVFWGPVYPIGWSIVAWLPLLVCGMLAATFFREFTEWYLRKREKSDKVNKQQKLQSGFADPDTILVEYVQDYSKIWGVVCDICSFTLLGAAIAVALSPNCLCVYNDTFETMRPEHYLPDEECPLASGRENYVWTCGITYNEFVDYIQPDPHHREYGRFPGMFSGAFGYMRTSSPLMLLWIFSMGFGNGYTARIFSSSVMTQLAPLGYPVYLLHMSIARYYVLATRGLNPEPWWKLAGEYPFPVEWYEFFFILGLTIIVGFVINSFLVPHLMPYSISYGVKVCTFISSFFERCRCCYEKDAGADVDNVESTETVASSESTYAQVKGMVRGLTGVEVNRSIQLRYLGLDSLGAAALLGMLRASVPAAKMLSLQDLQRCETVGDLADILDETSSV